MTSQRSFTNLKILHNQAQHQTVYIQTTKSMPEMRIRQQTPSTAVVKKQIPQ